jgi:uncharacterized protein (DUF362 family)
MKTIAGTGAVLSLTPAFADNKAQIYQITDCPEHDDQFRHQGLDALLDLIGANGIKLYQSGALHPWSGNKGIVAPNDVVLIKVNCQWKCRGTTNTDVLRGLIHRILQHPDGFDGEIVIFENGQGQGSFDGDPRAWGAYDAYPEINGVHVNAKDDTLTVDTLTDSVFKDQPVSSFLLDPVSGTFIEPNDHTTNGYRIIQSEKISYPCFTTRAGNRVELREGIWNGSEYQNNLKLINLPVFKTHGGTGITGVLKHFYGVLSMRDGYSNIRHYRQSGTQCGKMFSLVRMPDLNIVDCIWVTYQQNHSGYPPSTTHRNNILLAGLDPVALDYYGSKHILLPLGGDRAYQHDPDHFNGLKNHLGGALTVINEKGGINGMMAKQGDDHIHLISSTVVTNVNDRTRHNQPNTFELEQNHPNPFNAKTRIQFTLQCPSRIKLTIVNSRGQTIRNLRSEHLPAGSHSMTWDGLDNHNQQVSSGLYIYQLQVNGIVTSKKMTLMR